ncbi:outer membrane lipoprotein chaperone LolA [Rubrivivax albus]|uniref:Outer-membrane lipoprotein carrier protein n=1 Tax=Rubrivivax albus TaxID=2499835 RepID=A0A437JTC6_9BURK|nr:outer membrane lipoprotein chaperone LolA [Rubrivivax albus]RVT50190.1 outer membrane lipoprotein carrier protein LolA [Rubrivivax albus]
MTPPALVRRALLASALLCAALPARADAVDALREFVRQTRSGSADFTQVVTPADGTRAKTSSGRFEFARPDRFRFDYVKPYPQAIVSDGRTLWMHDPDLNQVTVRHVDKALGATPAALLAGEDLARDFTLAAQPDRDGMAWVRATPKAADSGFQWMAVGFKGNDLAAVEILDRFGQRTLLTLQGLKANAVLAPERFRFVPPPGADVLEQ